MAGTTEYIRPHPNANTLSVYVDKSYIELYINGKFVDTYQDTGTSFQGGQFGVFIDDKGSLIVDNLIIDKIGGN